MPVLAVDVLQLMPGFVSGANQLHNILVGATLVLAFAGLVVLVNQAFREQSLSSIWPTLARLIVVVVLTGSLIGWGNLLSGAVNDVISQMGISQLNGGVFTDYRNAVAQKFGSNSAAGAQGAPPSSNQVSAPVEGDTSGGFSPQVTGVKITHYGYPNDPTPDSKSAQGIGAFNFDSTPGSLKPLYSAALSPDVAQQYNVVPGQEFTVGLANGSSMTLQYADSTASNLTGRVDIYDPSGTLSTDGMAITSINDGAITGNQAGSGGWISKITDSLTIGLLWPLVHLLSLIALGCMWLMVAVQQIFYIVEIAVSPIFIGFLMIPRLVGTATRFFCSLVAISLWPIGWAVSDLLTKALIDMSVNPTNNLGETAFGSAATFLGMWVVLAIWVIGSSLMAPLLISVALMGGTSGLLTVFGATVGATAIKAAGSGRQAAVLAASAAGTPISAVAASGMSAYRNFARRPMSNGAEKA
jgi:hypothetical protein